MSSISNYQVSEPSYFYREYKNDFTKVESKVKLEQTQPNGLVRLALIAVPFFSLYKPFSQPLAIVAGAARTYTCSHSLYQAFSEETDTIELGYAFVQTAIAVLCLSGSIFAHPLGMLATTGQDLIINFAQLKQAIEQQNLSKGLEATGNAINNSLYLALFLNSSVELLVASLMMQIALGLYKSADEYKNERYLEAASNLLMCGARAYQLEPHLGLIKEKLREVDSSVKVSKLTNHLDLGPNKNVYRANQTRLVETNERTAQISDFGRNWMVITIIDDKTGKYPDWSQYLLNGDMILSSSTDSKLETVNGIDYVRHTHRNDLEIYSTDTAVYLVFPKY